MYRVHQAKHGIRILVVVPHEYVNIYSTRRLGINHLRVEGTHISVGEGRARGRVDTQRQSGKRPHAAWGGRRRLRVQGTHIGGYIYIYKSGRAHA